MAIDRDLYFADKAAMQRYKTLKFFSNFFMYGFLSILALFILIPFYWMIVTALKSNATIEFEQITGQLGFFPTEVTFDNFILVFGRSAQVNFARYYLNTIFVALASTGITIITTVLGAFAFARLNFKGKEALFTLLLATMMIPGEMMVITNYQTISVLQWRDTFMALIFPFSVSVFYMFYLRQTFQQIPNELYLASKVDGYGDFAYLWKVMIPIALPSIVTVIILEIMGSWNAYIWPQLVTESDSMLLVANGLMSIFQSSEFAQWNNIKLAASVVVTTPLLVFFLIFKKYIMRGVSRSGIKG
ncbi:MAG TPA: carbohydrate ABC transporter permease [Bacilli bacterium]|jgi:multiple sugar transport system permease protein|nr:carbohydrate ABC transporter permease [Bacilli bacterium]